MVEFHPLADALPLLEGEDFDALVKDIEANGQLNPVVRFEGKILDGRNRYRACQRLGIRVKQTEFYGDDPVAYVVSQNIARRHLTPQERAIAAEKLATAMQGRPRKGDKRTTITEAAELMDASPTSVKRVRRVRATAEPEVVEAMDAGEITPTAAENLATRSPEEQREIMHTSETPRDIAAKANQVAKGVTSGVGRGRVGPKVLMARHMDMPDLRVIQEVAADWEEHSDKITDLNQDRLASFLRELEKSRTAYTRLINLIKHGSPNGSRAKAAALKESSDKAHGKDAGDDKAASSGGAAAKKAATRKRTPAAKKETGTGGAAAKSASTASGKRAPRKTAARKTATGTTVAAVPDTTPAVTPETPAEAEA